MTVDHGSQRELLDALGALRRFWERPDRKRRFQAELGEPVELGVLRVLLAVEALTAEEAPDRGVGAVGRVLEVDDSTASRVVDQAARAGYLRRDADPADRRRTALVLTAEGRSLAARTHEIRCGWLSAITAGWSPEEVTALTALLRRFLDDARRVEEPPA